MWTVAAVEVFEFEWGWSAAATGSLQSLVLHRVSRFGSPTIFGMLRMKSGPVFHPSPYKNIQIKLGKKMDIMLDKIIRALTNVDYIWNF